MWRANGGTARAWREYVCERLCMWESEGEQFDSISSSLQPPTHHHQSLPNTAACAHKHTKYRHAHTLTHTHTLIVIPIGEHLRYMFTCAGQGVAHQRLLDKLSLIESGHTVQVEALQADHMTLGTLKHQHWSPGRHGEAWVTLTVYSYTTPHHIIKVFNVCPHWKQQCCDVIQ